MPRRVETLTTDGRTWLGDVLERRRQLMRESDADVARGGAARGRVIRGQRGAAGLLGSHLGVERVAAGGRQREREHGRQPPGDVTALTIECDHGLFSFWVPERSSTAAEHPPAHQD